MKKISLIIFLFFGFVVGGSLCSVTDNEYLFVLREYLGEHFSLIKGMGTNDGNPDIFKDLFKEAEVLFIPENKVFLDKMFSYESIKEMFLLNDYLSLVNASAQENKYLLYLKYQIILFKKMFSGEDDGENGLEEYLDQQELVIDFLINSHYGQDRKRLLNGLRDHKDRWFKLCKSIFLNAKSRFRAICMVDFFREKYPNLDFVIDIKGTDFGARFNHSSADYSSLREWLESKGLNPREISFEDLIEMLKKEPWILDKQFGRFKIHLMPKDEDLICATDTLITSFLSKKIGIGHNVSSFKVKASLEEVSSKDGCPKIVIYLKNLNSREDLDVIFKEIYDVFKEWKGLERGPNFNEKLGGIVYFAQGDRIDKVYWPELFTSDRVYFNEDKIKKLIKGDDYLVSACSTRDLRMKKRRRQLQNGDKKGRGGKTESSGRPRTRR